MPFNYLKVMIRSYACGQGLFSKGKYLFYAPLLEKIVFLLFFLYIARTTTADEYGLTIALFTFFNILSSFTDLGFPGYLQRETAVNSLIGKKLKTVIQVRLILFAVYLFAGLLYFREERGENFEIILSIGITSYLFSLNEIFTKILYGRDQFKEAFIFLSYSRFACLLIFALLFLLSAGTGYLIGALLASSVIHSLLLIRYLRADIPDINGMIDLPALRNILRKSLPIGLGLIFVWCYNKIDILLIGQILGMKEVASYAAAYAVYQFPQIFFGIILVPVYSKLSRDFQLYHKYEISFHFRVIAQLLLIALLSVLILTAFSETVILFLFGEQYSSSASILNLLSFALVPLSLNNYTGIVLNSSLNERKQMAGTFFGLTVNLALNLLLLKSYGIAGAAFATIITESAVLLIQSYFIFTRLKRQYLPRADPV